MEKLIELLGKAFKALLSSKTLWLIVVAIAIFTLALLLIDGTGLRRFFRISEFMNNYGKWIGPVALASIALILAKAAIWVLGQFFA